MSLINVERLREIAEVEFAGIVVGAFIAAEIEAVNQVLQTPYLSLGPRIVEFEGKSL